MRFGLHVNVPRSRPNLLSNSSSGMQDNLPCEMYNYQQSPMLDNPRSPSAVSFFASESTVQIQLKQSPQRLGDNLLQYLR